MKKYILYTKAQVNGWSYMKQRDTTSSKNDIVIIINTLWFFKKKICKKYGHNILKNEERIKKKTSLLLVGKAKGFDPIKDPFR
jgi:hypothetical protein